jgi:hypothetical protein
MSAKEILSEQMTEMLATICEMSHQLGIIEQANNEIIEIVGKTSIGSDLLTKEQIEHIRRPTGTVIYSAIKRA